MYTDMFRNIASYVILNTRQQSYRTGQQTTGRQTQTFRNNKLNSVHLASDITNAIFSALKKIPIIFVITMKIALPNANAFSHITFRNTNLWSPDLCRQTTIK